MATFKQKVAIKKMVENGGNASKAMRDAGYSHSTAKTPKKLTSSKGFRSILEASGLTPELVCEALVSDIKNKPGNRSNELKLAIQVIGSGFDNTEFLIESSPVITVRFQ